ncbi:hypothetical protein FH972_022988 [Carpinus fangiana]|uniref:Uncharacterized protein n=1 Tax=Carpinus fangiana TaxID=176857 RepID=A0A5N6KW43_9ROSI|nr:hypothetical protein FH972_022988 [Carpinus fangiana]
MGTILSMFIRTCSPEGGQQSIVSVGRMYNDALRECPEIVHEWMKNWHWEIPQLDDSVRFYRRPIIATIDGMVQNAMNAAKPAARTAKMKYTLPFPRALLSTGKNCATTNVEIQFAARAQLCVAPTASGPTNSLERMNGTGPRPRPNDPTKVKTAMADSVAVDVKIATASTSDEVPMPNSDKTRHLLRPSRSLSGAHDTVTTRLKSDTSRLMSADDVVSRSVSSDTP